MPCCVQEVRVFRNNGVEHVYGPGGQVLDGPKLRARMSKYNASCARRNGKRPSNLDNGASPSRPVGGKCRRVGKARSAAAKERWSDEILTRTILDKGTATAAARSVLGPSEGLGRVP